MENLIVKESKLGKGVFTSRFLRSGEKLIEWKGRTSEARLTEEDRKNVSYITQIGCGEYTVKSNKIDDFVNHSCDPNCGLKLEKSGVFLYSIKDIQEGEELFWDYSTTMTKRGMELFPEWREVCECGSEKCRKIIDIFSVLPSETKEKYNVLGIVPQYVRDGNC